MSGRRRLWSVASAARATGGRILGAERGSDAVVGVSGVSIDSRRSGRGDLFVGLEGERHDGAAFALDALRKGATAALISSAGHRRLLSEGALPRSGEPSVGRLIVLPPRVDGYGGLRRLASASRKRFGGRVAAITGSVGKTTVKDALALALSSEGETHASEASYNNHAGVPLTLCRMPADARFAVLEAGMSAEGELADHARRIRPSAAIVLNAAEAHLASLGSVDAVARAKAELILNAPKDAVAILNRDDPRWRVFAAAAKRRRLRMLSFGESAEADVRVIVSGAASLSTRGDVDVDGRRVPFRIPLGGRAKAVVVAGAVAATSAAFGVDPRRTLSALAALKIPRGRGNLRRMRLPQGRVALLDESYNANPSSMRAAIETLGMLRPTRGGRRVAVIGDMLELGERARDMHLELASSLVAARVDAVHGVGASASEMVSSLPRRMRGFRAASAEELARKLPERLRDGDRILVKGSRGVGVDRVVSAIRSAARTGRVHSP